MNSLSDLINKALNDPLFPKKKEKNSAAFDKASYEADGGDGWMDTRRLPFFENPSDKGLWDKVKRESQEIYGKENKKFMIWLYKKQGGRFLFNNEEEIEKPKAVGGIRG